MSLFRVFVRQGRANLQRPVATSQWQRVVHLSSAPRRLANDPCEEELDPVARIRVANESQRSMASNLPPVHDSLLDALWTSPSLFEEAEAVGQTEQSPTTSAEPDVLLNLHQRIPATPYKHKKIHVTPEGERAFVLDPLPTVPADVYETHNAQTAAWLSEVLEDSSSPSKILVYVGFEAFYNPFFPSLAARLKAAHIPVVLSPLVTATREYLCDRDTWDALLERPETLNGEDLWSTDHLVIHCGAAHAMDRLLFAEDPDGHLQKAWTTGRLVVLAPQLVVTPTYVYRAALGSVVQQVVEQLPHKSSSLTKVSPYRVTRVEPCDYNILDADIEEAQRRVDAASTMEEAIAEIYRLVIRYMKHLDAPCYFDSGWESFHLYKAVSQILAKDKEDADLKIPWTRVGLIQARNAAIGDSLHTFYATAPQSFPIVVSGDTAALLAGGISMLNIQAAKRFGVVFIPNNRGMAIEDVISKRSVDGHQYQYEYVKLDRKRDVFTLAQLKEVLKSDVLASLRDHLWGVSAHRSEALVVNIDVQSLRRENAGNAPTDAVLMGGSFLSEDFGQRFQELQGARRRLESIVRVLYHELNDGNSTSLPVKIQGCSAIEFMEVMSQLSITMRDKVHFLPTPTDLLATRTLLPSLLEAPQRVVSQPLADSNFVNSNHNFSVFVSNAVFGVDGLNNLISTHLEYGDSNNTLIHLAYDAADVVTHYSLLGQVHRPFGVRPSTLLPSLYATHQAYDGQIKVISFRRQQDDDDRNSGNQSPADELVEGLRNPNVRAILVDMGAPNLTASLK